MLENYLPIKTAAVPNTMHYQTLAVTLDFPMRIVSPITSAAPCSPPPKTYRRFPQR